MTTSNRCEPCSAPAHDPGECSNTVKPMIHRTCACDCGRRDFNPAPYWTTPDTAHETAEES